MNRMPICTIIYKISLLLISTTMLLNAYGRSQIQKKMCDECPLSSQWYVPDDKLPVSGRQPTVRQYIIVKNSTKANLFVSFGKKVYTPYQNPPIEDTQRSLFYNFNNNIAVQSYVLSFAAGDNQSYTYNLVFNRPTKTISLQRDNQIVDSISYTFNQDIIPYIVVNKEYDAHFYREFGQAEQSRCKECPSKKMIKLNRDTDRRITYLGELPLSGSLVTYRE